MSDRNDHKMIEPEELESNPANRKNLKNAWSALEYLQRLELEHVSATMDPKLRDAVEFLHAYCKETNDWVYAENARLRSEMRAARNAEPDDTEPPTTDLVVVKHDGTEVTFPAPARAYPRGHDLTIRDGSSSTRQHALAVFAPGSWARVYRSPAKTA